MRARLASVISVTSAVLAALAVIGTSPSTASAAGFGAAIARVEQRSTADNAADSRGVFARLGILGSLSLELDLARFEYADGTRTDRRFGAGLHLDIPGFRRWQPFLLAGVGVLHVQAQGWDGELAFTEIGGGIAYRFARAARLELDFRSGELELLQTRQNGDVIPLAVLPTVQTDEYRAVRLSVAIEF